ncbi:hypothetical protein CLI64_11015 [Nostoc sp. CENA543]|uniref:hypothetical protein n=1 Tax=Nostoc sp. CENA543 TaxID=1869241 RepID=UPI000CA1A3AF|nr:hypothetical protein [Nostoc sp. CENA543]AUT00884.1 hypothetical protein CLI64_11015 [Nostoc sp. CENA543]
MSIIPQNPKTASSGAKKVSTLVIATDSEWDKTVREVVKSEWLSTQFSTYSKLTGEKRRYLFVSNDVSTPCYKRLMSYELVSGVKVIFVEMSDSLNLIEYILNDCDKDRQHKNINLLMFYSPKDLEYAFGWDFIQPLYMSGAIQQKRNISCRPPFVLEVNEHKYTVDIKDMKGWSGNSGLKALADAVGVKMQSKAGMDSYKTHMRDGLEAFPDLFAAYSMGDVDDLLSIYSAFVELVRWVQHEVIGLPKEMCFNEENIPMTTGSLVAKTLESWIYCQGDRREIEFAIKKLGLLDSSDKEHKKNLDHYHNVIEVLNTRNKLRNSIAEYSKSSNSVDGRALSQFFRLPFSFLGISQCSVNYFARITEDSSAFNALVQGGRCNNERPSEYVCELGADIDLNSCYGSALRAFTFPLGLPTVWGWKPNQKRMSLKQWLAKYESDLVDNLWTVTVSGEIKFCQDLIYSKIVSQKDINRAALGEDWDKETDDTDRDDDVAHIPGHFALIRKQIQNGIITSDVLKVLRAVATNKELNELMSLTVESAAAYLKSDEVPSVDAWIECVVSDKGSLENVNGKRDLSSDTRTRKWVSLHLEGFIGKLVDVRGGLKSISNSGTAPAEEKTTATAKQEILKLFVNTSYGVSASPYFSVGNTVLANNITARARVGAWMLNKALHTRQSITDGGFYSLLHVPTLKDSARLPGFDTLSDNTKWTDTKNYTRITTPLAGLDWASIFSHIADFVKESDPATLPKKSKDWGAFLKAVSREVENLDSLAKEHIDKFWNRYNLSLPFNIEHKIENCFSVASFINKAHYYIHSVYDGEVFKIRGARNYEESALRKHPSYELLKGLAFGGDYFPSDLNYDHKSLLKINKWVMAQASAGFDTVKQVRPGDELIEVRTARYNNTHIFCESVDDFKRRSERKTVNRGEKLEWFERARANGFSKVHALMMLDTLQLGTYKK